MKIAGLLVIIMVALFASILAGRTASQYFAKASGCPATDIKAINVGTNNAMISWTTKDATQGRVQYGTDPSDMGIMAEAVSGTSHSVPLTLLTPNTPYYFLVVIGDNACDSTGTGCDKNHLDKCSPFTFTTAPLAIQQEPVAPIINPTVIPPMATGNSGPLGAGNSGGTSPAGMANPSASSPAALILPTIVTSSSINAPTVASSSGTNGGLSVFCQQVQQNVTASSSSPNWEALKQYDLDANGVINGMDVIKCKESGK